MEKIICPSNCGACCRGKMDIFLSEPEAMRRKAAGQKLVALLPHTETHATPEGAALLAPIDHSARADEYRKAAVVTQPGTEERRIANVFASLAPYLEPGETIYAAETDCPFIGADNNCTSYEERDRVCRVFPAGSKACIEKFRGGEPIPVSITTRSKSDC